MLLMFIGIAVAFIGLFLTEGNGSTVVIVGAVIAFLGFCMSSWHTERTRANINRTMYWSRGRKPDWAEEEDEEGGKEYRPLPLWKRLIIIYSVAAVILILSKVFGGR